LKLKSFEVTVEKLKSAKLLINSGMLTSGGRHSASLDTIMLSIEVLNDDITIF